MAEGCTLPHECAVCGSSCETPAVRSLGARPLHVTHDGHGRRHPRSRRRAVTPALLTTGSHAVGWSGREHPRMQVQHTRRDRRQLMTVPNGFRIADLGGEPSYINELKKVFIHVSIDWSRPRRWDHIENPPIDDSDLDSGHLYIITRNHHLQKVKENITYIGITEDIKNRFRNHPVARKILERRGETFLSIGTLTLIDSRRSMDTVRKNIEEIEHILIWAIWYNSKLENERKIYAMLGFGKHRGRGWHIENHGYRFAGRMPGEIVYPWMLIKHKRD